MLQYFVFFTFILCLIHSHALCAVETTHDGREVVESVEGIASEAGNWIGIDVSIVGKYAEKYGHPPRDPYINTDHGDLLLFVFTLSGLIAGIIIGYNFRKLFVEKEGFRN